MGDILEGLRRGGQRGRPSLPHLHPPPPRRPYDLPEDPAGRFDADSGMFSRRPAKGPCWRVFPGGALPVPRPRKAHP